MTIRQIQAVCTMACCVAIASVWFRFHRQPFNPAWHEEVKPVPPVTITAEPLQQKTTKQQHLQPDVLLEGVANGLPVRIVQYHAFRGRINVNTAPQELLELLPGVGKSTAEAMVLVRRRLGGFSTPEDLLLVPGFGERYLERVRSMITCEPSERVH